MSRDFTAAAQQELLQLVREVESEKWCDITDWVGDRFIGLRQLVGELNIDRYLSRMNQYHKAVIDKNNATEADINAIFDEVYAVDNCFVTRFAAAETRLDNYTELIRRMAATIDPAGGSHTIADLDADFATYDQQDKALGEIETSEDGLSQKTLDAMDPEVRESMVSRIISNVVDTLPGFEHDGTVELAIGSGLVLYYTVKSKLDGGKNSPIDLTGETKYGAEEGRARLKDFDSSVTVKTPGDEIEVERHQDGNTKFAVNDGRYKTSIDGDGVAQERSWESGGATYKYKYGYKPATNEVFVEESVEVKTEHGSVTTTAGIKATEQNRWRRVPVPAYDPQPVPVPSIPQPDWRVVVVAGTVIIVAGVVIVVSGGSAAPALVPVCVF